jgi:dipeptidyl aminopeptidase/acylaminoacyl peptidase
VDLLAERELIDPNRLGMVGGSTGGYFVLATLIQRPKTFKAAVSWYTGTADLAAIVDPCLLCRTLGCARKGVFDLLD